LAWDLSVIIQTWDQMQKELLKKYYPIANRSNKPGCRAQGSKYRISGSYRMVVFISDMGYRGRYRGYAHISGVYIEHYI